MKPENKQTNKTIESNIKKGEKSYANNINRHANNINRHEFYAFNYTKLPTYQIYKNSRKTPLVASHVDIKFNFDMFIQEAHDYCLYAMENFKILLLYIYYVNENNEIKLSDNDIIILKMGLQQYIPKRKGQYIYISMPYYLPVYQKLFNNTPKKLYDMIILKSWLSSEIFPQPV